MGCWRSFRSAFSMELWGFRIRGIRNIIIWYYMYQCASKRQTQKFTQILQTSVMSVNSCNPSYADSLYLIIHCLTRNHLVLPCYVSTCFMPVLCNEPPIKVLQIDVWIHDLLQRVGRSEFVSYRRCWMWSRPYGLCQERTNMQENCKEFRPQSMQELLKVQLSVHQLKKSLETIGDFVCNMIWMCNNFLSFRNFIVQCSNDHRIVDLFGGFPYWYRERPLPRGPEVLPFPNFISWVDKFNWWSSIHYICI